MRPAFPEVAAGARQRFVPSAHYLEEGGRQAADPSIAYSQGRPGRQAAREPERRERTTQVGWVVFFLARALAALRRFAIRLSAYFIATSSMTLGSYSSSHSLASAWFG